MGQQQPDVAQTTAAPQFLMPAPYDWDAELARQNVEATERKASETKKNQTQQKKVDEKK